jgi:hypothetical protein
MHTDCSYPCNRYDGPFFEIKFHPASSRLPIRIPFDEYIARETKDRQQARLWHEPWFPFPTQVDFEFAEFCTESGLSDGDINRLLNAMRGSWASGCKIKALNAAEIHKLCRKASGSSAEVDMILVLLFLCLCLHACSLRKCPLPKNTLHIKKQRSISP